MSLLLRYIYGTPKTKCHVGSYLTTNFKMNGFYMRGVSFFECFHARCSSLLGFCMFFVFFCLSGAAFHVLIDGHMTAHLPVVILDFVPISGGKLSKALHENHAL